MQRPAAGRLYGVCVGSLGARRAPGRKPRLFQRHQRFPARGRAGKRALHSRPGAAARHRRLEGLHQPARGAGAAGRGPPPWLRPLPRARLRRADRPPGRDGHAAGHRFPGAWRRTRTGVHRRGAAAGPGAHRRRRAAHLRDADRLLRAAQQAGALPGQRQPLRVHDHGHGRRLRRPGASREHRPDGLAQGPAGTGPAGPGRRLSRLSRPGQPRVLPYLERQAHQAGRLRALRSGAARPDAAAMGVRGLHLVLRRSAAAALADHHPQRLPAPAGQDHFGRGARAGPPQAIGRGKFVRRLDPLLQAGRELPQCAGQLLHQGLAGRAGPGPADPPRQRRRPFAR
ncbi:Uncharacterised protein [Bordetella pertussis]|nr:Uncharacterised protein [Bordetella pertussis]CFM42274.1 Uncharacterised protein [Bordetella pertussis]CFM51508.1 Uncharacterised protein [Bordetella pertussis]CFM95565.1 Uncharacterised protein [Bordetella pertussis]CFN52916.1 Uncharacterised protein [Bordetella pertussis]